MNKRLLVIAPHSFCTNDVVRHCDTVAARAVKELKKSFSKHDAIFHVSDRKREEGDYNRPITDNSPWRKKARDLAYMHDPDFVLEIHSYPGEYKMYKDVWGDSELVIFKSSQNNKFIDRLVSILKKNDPGLKVVKGSPYDAHPVSITDDITKLKKKHTLFEFNEEQSPGRIAEIADNVGRAVIEMLDEKIKPPSLLTVYVVIIIILIVFAFSSCVILFRRQGYMSPLPNPRHVQ